MMRFASPLLLIAAILLLPATASAYVGPGAGLSAIGSMIALVGAIVLAIVGFVWYPVKRLMRRLGAGGAPGKPEESSR